MGLKFLIADDSANIRMFIKKTLGLTGLPVESIIEASDGKEALDLLVNNKDLDIVLTDINMPVMDGLELIAKIRENPENSKLHIMVVSTEGSREKIIECMKLGANVYIKKPFTPEDILQKISSLDLEIDSLQGEDDNEDDEWGNL